MMQVTEMAWMNFLVIVEHTQLLHILPLIQCDNTRVPNHGVPILYERRRSALEEHLPKTFYIEEEVVQQKKKRVD
jgi:hypothetical protein